MRRQLGHALSVAAAVAGTALVAMGTVLPAAGPAAAAGSARSPVIYTTSQAGYVTGGGRHFRFVAATVKVAPALPAKAGYAGIVLGGARIADPATLLARAGGKFVGWNFSGVPSMMAGGRLNISPKPGDLLRMSIYYDQHGHVYFTAVDATQGTRDTFKAPVRAGTLYTAAEVADFDGYTTAAPHTAFRLWAFTGIRVTTYSGVRGTMTGPWITSKILHTTTGGAGGAVVTYPSGLWLKGQNFGVWR